MYTFNKIMESFDRWGDVGVSYDDQNIMVYSGDLRALYNRFSHSNAQNRLTDIAEHYGAELRFYGETIADNNGRIHNTIPTHYGWIPTFMITSDGDIWAEDEVNDSSLESYADVLINNDNQADLWKTDFSRLGFVKYDKQGESGFHYGQNDTPQNMRDEIENAFGECDIIWSIDGSGQFDVMFSAWYKPKEGMI